MNPKISSELWWVATTSLMTALFWVPYTAQLIREMGVIDAFWDPYHDTPIKAAWAQRAKRAHLNAIENLAIFAPLALAVHLAGAGTPATALASAAYFFARAAHFIVYTLAVPLVRSFLFLAGFCAQVTLALALINGLH